MGGAPHGRKSGKKGRLKMKDFQALPANACEWDAEKIMYIFKAVKNILGIQLWGEAQTGINQKSGNVWVWSEDYPVCFFMPISCELQPDDVWVNWSDPDDGEEHEAQLTDFHSIDDIYAWVEKLEAEARV